LKSPLSGRPALGSGATAREIVGMMPVELGVVEEELQALPAALVGEHLERVLLVGRGVDDVPLVLLCREHGEAIVMPYW